MTSRLTRSRATTGSQQAGIVIAVILSIGICTALNLLTFGVLWDALTSSAPGISENATQILTGWGGGVIGVIGALVGYKAGESRQAERERARDDTDAVG